MNNWFNTGPIPEIAETFTKGFGAAEEDANADFFVVYSDAGVFAYRNECPHTHAPLEWIPDQFLDMENHYIQCSIHGALFRANDGFCLHGPCVSESLIALQTEIRNGELWVNNASN